MHIDRLGKIRRRDLIVGGGGLLLSPTHGWGAESESDAPAPSLRELIRNPLLIDALYRRGVSSDVDLDTGAAELNRHAYTAIGFQRQGAEWIIHGVAADRDDWRQLGWRVLDRGIAYQQSDGGFGGAEVFFSTAQFIEALGRACLVDPSGATPGRVRSLTAGARWLGRPANLVPGHRALLPYTHRRYILAAAQGQAGAVSGERLLSEAGARWAREGISLQRPDGVNPERGGFDVSYQMAGVLMAQRYLAACDIPSMRAGLRAMTRRAVSWELSRQTGDGRFDADGSSRVGRERLSSGALKQVGYNEALQGLVYAALSTPESKWFDAAYEIAGLPER